MRATILLLATAAVLAAVATAEAARAPGVAERKGITTAVRKASPKAPRACFPLTIRVSTVDSRFAVAGYRSARACARVTGNGLFLLQRGSSKTWRVLAYGSPFRCTTPVRAAVMRDLVSYCRKR